MLGGGFKYFLFFIPTWGRLPFWLYNILQMGWNHQLGWCFTFGLICKTACKINIDWEKKDILLPEPNSKFAPENWWLEYFFVCLLGEFRPIFRCVLVSFRERILFFSTNPSNQDDQPFQPRWPTLPTKMTLWKAAQKHATFGGNPRWSILFPRPLHLYLDSYLSVPQIVPMVLI